MSRGAVRVQHLVPAIAILVLAIVVAWLSYTREPAGAFLFPRLIATVMLVLAIWNGARVALGLARVGDGLDVKEAIAILPGVIVMLVYVLIAAKWLGFYVASFATFIILFSLYDPSSHLKSGTWLRRVAIAAGFMLVMYGLFSMLLKVQTPRGLYF